MARYSLDTNTISNIVKRDRRVVERYQAALTANDELIICPVVYYEIKRGLLRKDARKQMIYMNRLVATFSWQEFETGIWEAAAQGWAHARQRGEAPQDTDLLIAYHAHHFSAIVVTDNVKHFQRFPIKIENWRASEA